MFPLRIAPIFLNWNHQKQKLQSVPYKRKGSIKVPVAGCGISRD
jgi:hypothetical protein